MNRLPFILSSIAVAVLAGCATESRISSAPAPVVAPAPAAAAPAPVAPTYSVGAAGTTIVVPQASPAATAAPSPAATPLHVGFGRIESITVVPTASAAAGGTAPNPSKRIAMRMDNGTVQYFDTHAEGLTVGDRIEITTNGTMRHPA